MDWSQIEPIVTDIIKALLTAFGVWVLAVIKRYFATLTQKANAATAVKAAEQTMPDATGDQKAVLAQKIAPKMTPALREEAVLNMKNAAPPTYETVNSDGGAGE